MYQQVMLGPIRHPENRRLVDLNLREWLAVGPLIAVALAMGLFPQPFLSRLEPSAKSFVARMGGQSFHPPSSGGGDALRALPDLRRVRPMPSGHAPQVQPPPSAQPRPE
jgi:hypothetical protein